MNNLITFFKEAWSELKQVSWLTTPQMIASTWMVIFLVIVMSLFVSGVDFVLTHVIAILV